MHEDPLESLSRFHRRIERQLTELVGLQARLEEGMDAPAAGSAAGLIDFFDTRVRVHHAQEEHELIPLPRLAALVASGELRFAVLDGGCGETRAAHLLPGCSSGAAWVRAHGIDVSRRAGLGHGGVLYRLRTR